MYMLRTFPKDFSQVATSKIYNLPNGNFLDMSLPQLSTP